MSFGIGNSMQAGSYQVVHMVQCTTNNSSNYWKVVQCTTKNVHATVKKWCKIKSNITFKKVYSVKVHHQ